MASSNDNVSMALFCDFENVALGVRDANYDKFDIKPVLERLLLKGSIVVKKAYCDWDRYKAFKAPMHEANFELIEIPHVRQSGKNSADIRMVVDALDLCYTKSHVDTFVIISGDSDFSPLVSKLRENAKKVIGVGVKQSTSDLLVANCDEFIFYDDLVRESRRAKRDAGEASKPAVKRSPEEERGRREEMDKRRNQAVEIAVNTFEALVLERGDSGKIWASVLKEAIKRRKPDFSESYYGFRTFGNLIEECKARGLLEFGRDEKSGAYVYRSSGASNGAMQGAAESQASDHAGADAQEGGKQESRRSRGRGRTAAERFAERQAERLAQQARAGQDADDRNPDDDADADADRAAPVVEAYAAWQGAPEQPSDQPSDQPDAAPDAQPSAQPEAERNRGRGRGNRGGRKQGERQGQGGVAAAEAPVVTEMAVDLPFQPPVAETDDDVVQAAPVDAVAPAKKKSGAKPPARKVKAAAKPQAEEGKPAKGGKGGKGRAAAAAEPVALAVEAAAPVVVEAEAPSAPAKPAKPRAPRKPRAPKAVAESDE
ncbi:TIGR00288 family protein [Duganella sp. CF517]|uniref:NYN domain-containing protein n=1 Tax=Duganella sp. CF517 TaxID=1881038 RepID=UPI0008C5A83B|nr:NYN domain-containing protein [Duganella sp. CF517]SEO50544.1 TIGR00288 family protein [Duganella sp. CF517]